MTPYSVVSEEIICICNNRCLQYIKIICEIGALQSGLHFQAEFF